MNVNLSSEKEADDKIKIDLYFESQCPGCKQLITGSFTEAMKADGFLDMAEINLWPYGNAHEKQSAVTKKWSFTCQHGAAECQYNLIETCAKSMISCPMQSFNFMSCIESNDSGSNYVSVANKCASEHQVDNIADILTCYKGDEGLELEH